MMNKSLAQLPLIQTRIIMLYRHDDVRGGGVITNDDDMLIFGEGGLKFWKIVMT